MVVVGLVVMAGTGIFLSWQSLAIMTLPLPFIFATLVWWLPPSPAWLLERGKEVEARKILAWLSDLQLEDVQVPRNPLREQQEPSVTSLRQLTGDVKVRVAEVGSISARAKMTIKTFVKRVFPR